MQLGLNEGFANVAQGTLRGKIVSGTSIKSFLGVPYAAAPIGDLRWKAPQAPLPWGGVRRAFDFGANSYHHEFDPQSFYGQEFPTHLDPKSEDCLFLNVWTPAHAENERLPVLLWIHGGAFNWGASSDPVFDGVNYARHGVILVTINYRLGILGFLAHPLLSAESAHSVSGNYGVLDQIAAIKWVKENIAAFGGDPDRITISGQSAGAASVNALLASPLAQGIFSQAIIQSGSAYSRAMRNLPLRELEAQGVQWADTMGTKTLEQMRSLSAADILETQRGGKYRFGPCIDGWMLSDHPARAISAGLCAQIPMLMGCTSDESTTLSSRLEPNDIDPAQYRRDAQESFGEYAQEFFELYPCATAEEVIHSSLRSFCDTILAGMRLQASEQSAYNPNVYLYYFNRVPPGHDSQYYGAYHSAELSYLFATQHVIKRPWEPADQDLSAIMSQYWANFVSQGDPNGNSLPPWPRYCTQQDQLMELGDHIGARTIPYAQRVDFLTRLIQRDMGLETI